MYNNNDIIKIIQRYNIFSNSKRQYKLVMYNIFNYYHLNNNLYKFFYCLICDELFYESKSYMTSCVLNAGFNGEGKDVKYIFKDSGWCIGCNETCYRKFDLTLDIKWKVRLVL